MVKRLMKQRVAVALICCTAWLMSIVGASVPSGETTAFPNLRPSGPSSDQYTPPLRHLHNYQRQHDHGRGWMSDPPTPSHPGINVRNREEKSNAEEIDRAPNYELLSNRERSSSTEKRRTNDLKDDRSDVELPDSAEAQRLSSMKVAFDDPIDFLDDIEEGEDGEAEGDMQRDEFLGDDTFEDEGPGSVEVYKLDLFKDVPVRVSRPAKRNQNHQRTKSKTPKKANWKSVTTASKEPAERKSNQRGLKHVEETSAPSRSLKERIFGAGGVPELQVGCEGVEGSQQRQKRSELKKIVGVTTPLPPLSSDIDYILDDYYDLIEGPDDPRYSALPRRGDMSPKIKTPADIEAGKILRKSQLPKRGDLGAAWEESLSKADRVSVKEEVRAKRSPKLNTGEGENGIINSTIENEKLKRRHRRRGRRYGKRGGKKLNSIHGGSRRRSLDELKSRKEEDLISLEKFQVAEPREKKIFTRNQPPYSESEEAEKIRVENERKLADYIRRNTPIRPMRNDVEKTEPDEPPAALIRGHDPSDPDFYAIRRYELLEQRRRMTAKINRTTFEEERDKREDSETIRPESRAPQDRVSFKKRTQEEIDRLNRLPIKSFIVIDTKDSNAVPPVVESRFGTDSSDSSTPSPLKRGPSPCVWAIVNCCSNKKRLTACFEAKGCPGGYWDDSCTTEKISSALQTVAHYYGH